MNVTRGILRTNLTYVAFATDDEELQEQLPNILIGNENTFPAGRFETLYAAAPDNFYLIRKKKAWNNTDVMLQIVRLLARIRSGLRANPFLLLVLDTAYCHINREVLAVCMTNDIFPLIVPACTTWLLQPLEVYVFSNLQAEVVAGDCFASCAPLPDTWEHRAVPRSLLQRSIRSVSSTKMA